MNIYKELKDDVGFEIPKHGNLQKWTEQGVFLLNAMLTVEANQPASHQKKGWEEFTDADDPHVQKAIEILKGGA